MDSLIQKLERGKESCHEMTNMLQKLLGSSSSLDHHHQQQQLYDDGDESNNISYLKVVDGHSKVVQTTLYDALFILRSFDFIEDVINMRRPKVGRTDINDSPTHFSKFEDKFGGKIPKHVTPPKDRRGCYNRRRNEQARVIDTMNLSDDGYAWRKYGQKLILHFTHPRSYFRCTHKIDEGCQATKQVQQISENPPKYRIIYHRQHTCKSANTPNNNPIILFDSIDDNQNSSILLNFDTSKQSLNYPFMFPQPTTSSTTPSSSSSSGVALLNGSSIKEEVIASESLNTIGGTNNIQYTSPSPDQYAGAPSPDVTTGTTITAVSDNLADVISSTEIYSPLSNVHGMDTDGCYSNMWDDVLINLDDLYSQPNLA